MTRDTYQRGLIPKIKDMLSHDGYVRVPAARSYEENGNGKRASRDKSVWWRPWVSDRRQRRIRVLNAASNIHQLLTTEMEGQSRPAYLKPEIGDRLRKSSQKNSTVTGAVYKRKSPKIYRLHPIQRLDSVRLEAGTGVRSSVTRRVPDIRVRPTQWIRVRNERFLRAQNP